MRLYEFEGKEILKKYGIPVPHSYGVATIVDRLVDNVHYPFIAKIQVLEGARGKRGGVQCVENATVFSKVYETMVRDFGDRKPYGVLVEDVVPEGQDFYLSIAYREGRPVVCANRAGGVEVEESRASTLVLPLDILSWNVDEITRDLEPVFGPSTPACKALLHQLLTCFFDEDATFLEINPLRHMLDGSFVALDIKMTLDEAASFRHEAHTALVSLPRESGRMRTERERAVEVINTDLELRGSPARYVELDGDVALLLSGGGASLCILDALVASGVRPGNYSEYSGNPKREKVAALARVVLDKPGQRGLFIAGGVANFTMVDETLAGIEDALREVRPNYPIVIRRGGPNETIAKENIAKLAEETGMDITWLGSDQGLTEASRLFAQKLAAPAAHHS
jgi:citryl-CoA synthetase large subunit